MHICTCGLPWWLISKESICNAGAAGDMGLIPGLGRPPGEGKGYPLQDSGLENSMDSPWSCKELDTTERLPLHWLSEGFLQLGRMGTTLFQSMGFSLQRLLLL